MAGGLLAFQRALFLAKHIFYLQPPFVFCDPSLIWNGRPQEEKREAENGLISKDPQFYLAVGSCYQLGHM